MLCWQQQQHTFLISANKHTCTNSSKYRNERRRRMMMMVMVMVMGGWGIHIHLANNTDNVGNTC